MSVDNGLFKTDCFKAYLNDCRILGVVEYLSTEISTSKQKKFSLVTFVDTPGLVDGDMKYPFDVDETILWLGREFMYHVLLLPSARKTNKDESR
jgi:hypothetical protein